MKKLLGVCFLFVFAFAVMPFCAGALGGADSLKVSASNNLQTDLSEFEDGTRYFKSFDETSGIFIVKDSNTVFDKDSKYVGAVQVSSSSGELDDYEMFKYEALREIEVDGRMQWSPTDFLSVQNDGEIIKNALSKTASYSLLKNAPAGRYGIRVTAYEDGTGTAVNGYQDAKPAYLFHNGQSQAVSSVYVVAYGEKLEYIYCVDARTKYKSNSFYKVSEKGNGTGTVKISVMVNPGAIAQDRSEIDVVGNAVVGNLTLDSGVSLDSLSMRIENERGKVLADTVIPVSVQDGYINLSLPKNLGTGKYILRVWHASNPDVSGSFLIDNGGDGGGTTSTADAGTVLLVFGLVIIFLGAVMFVWPRVQLLFQTSAAEREEAKRLKRAGIDAKKEKEKASRTAYQTAQAITKQLEESKNLSEAERDELVLKRNEEYSKTKSGGFLQKLNESRLKREIARDAGISMEDFKSMENKKLRIDDAKKHGLSELRGGLNEELQADDVNAGANAVKLGSIAITEQQEQDAKEKFEKGRLTAQNSEAGKPEFELLDSMKEEGGIQTDIKAEEQKTDIEKVVEANKEAEETVKKQQGSSLLNRIKKFTGEEE